MAITQKFLAPLAVLLGLFLFLAAPAVYAQDNSLFENATQEACNGANLKNSGGKCDDANGASKVGGVISAIINILTIIIGVVAVIMIIINGFRFITSNGDANNVAAAKNGIIYAIVGLIIVALAQVIVRFILSRI